MVRTILRSRLLRDSGTGALIDWIYYTMEPGLNRESGGKRQEIDGGNRKL